MHKTILSAVGVTAFLLALPFAATAVEPAPDILVEPAGAPRPTVSISIPRYTNKSTISITITKTDPSGSGITGYYVSENPTTPGLGNAGWKGQKPGSFTLSAGEGSRIVYAWVKNANGDISVRDSDNTDVDKTDPTVSLTAPASSTTRHIDLTITGSDDVGGVGITAWAIVGGTAAPTSGSDRWKTAPPVGVNLPVGNGIKTISAFTRDAAGNVSAPDTSTVVLDVPAPTVTLTMPSYTRTLTVSVTLARTDPGGTGIAGYYLSQSATTPLAGGTGWQIQPTTFTLSAGQGSKTVYAWVKDANGTVSAPSQDDTFVDLTLPTSALTAPTSSTTRLIAVTVTGSDTPTGVLKWAVVAGTAAPASSSTAWVTSAPTSFTMPYGNGLKTVSAFTRDYAGNVSAAASRTVTLNVPPPTVTISIPATSTTALISVSLNRTDPGGVGITGFYLSESPTTPSAGGAGWKIQPTNFTLAANGLRTVYAWVKDASGAISAPDSDQVLFDNVAPTVSLTAPNYSPTQLINVTITGTDATSGITAWAVVAGTTAPATGNSAWKTSAPTSFTVSAGDGSKTVSAFTRDALGNVSAASTETVVFDASAPTVSLSAPAATVTRPITVTVTGTDATSGITDWALVEGTSAPASGSTAWKASAPTTITLSAGDGIKTITAFSRDAAGNVSGPDTQTVAYDTTQPSVSLSASAYSSTQAVPVSITGTDATSGITSWAIVQGTAEPGSGSSAWKASPPTTITVSAGDGNKTITAFSRDAAGNVSGPDTRTVMYDASPPTVSLTGTPATTTTALISVTITGSDATSGITRWAIVNGTSAPSSGSSAWKTSVPTSFTFSSDGNKTISAFSRDAAGNVAARSTRTVVFDSTPPTVSLSAPNYSQNPLVNVTITGTDATSGITDWAIVEGTTAPGSGSSAWKASAPTSVTLSAGDGGKTITAFSRDAFGYVSTGSTQTVTLDGAAPSVSLSAPDNTTTELITVTITGNDATSGITDWAIVEGTTAPGSGSGAWTSSAPTSFNLSSGDGDKTITAFSRDAAGNVSAGDTRTVALGPLPN